MTGWPDFNLYRIADEKEKKGAVVMKDEAQLVKRTLTSLAGGIEAEHQDANFFAPKDFGQKLPHAVVGVYVVLFEEI